jgi:hypothetical protein
VTTTDTHGPADPADEFALPAFEEALWSALRAEHARAAASATIASTSTADDVEVLDPIARSPRRPPLRRSLAAAAAVALVGMAAALGVRAGGDGEADERPVATDVSSTEPSTTGPSTTVPVEEQAAAALTDLAATNVVGTEERTGGVLVSRGWADQSSGAVHTIGYLTDGESPGFELGLASPIDPDGGLLVDPVLRAIDHCARQHSEDVGPTMSGFDALSRLAQDLREGRAIIDGTEQLEEGQMLVVRPVHTRIPFDVETGETSIPDPPETTIETYQATYLDPETYAPVLTRQFAVGDRPEETTTYVLSPRSATGLDLLVAHAPEGYTAVAAVPTNEERAAAGCL